MSRLRLCSFIVAALLVATLFGGCTGLAPASASVKVSHVSTITTVSNDFKISRVPHQRKSFYAEGLWWFFYAAYPNATSPGPLKFRTSSDEGATWSSPTNLGYNVAWDAVWAVAYDQAHNKVWVGLSNAANGPFYGFIVRRGAPQSNGTIAWDAPWQAAIAASSRLSDPSMVVDTNGHLWIGTVNITPGEPSYGYVTKNAHTDGTWATASGFPVTLASGVQYQSVLVPLAGGGMYAVCYLWNKDVRATGFVSADGSSAFKSEGQVTANPVEAKSGSAAQVGRIFADSRGDGVVRVVYQSTAQDIIYAQRDVNGTWTRETTLATGAESNVSSPMLTFNPTTGDMCSTWTAYQTLYCAVCHNNSWAAPVPLYHASFEDTFEHAISSQFADPRSNFLVSTLDSSYNLLVIIA